MVVRFLMCKLLPVAFPVNDVMCNVSRGPFECHSMADHGVSLKQHRRVANRFWGTIHGRALCQSGVWWDETCTTPDDDVDDDDEELEP